MRTRVENESMLLAYSVILTCIVYAPFTNGYGHNQFNGGTMSYTVKETNVPNQHEINIQLITGWVLGKGPCGNPCTKTDIGRDTSHTRQIMKDMYGDTYFGQWFQENNIKDGDIDITNVVMSNVTGVVKDVSNQSQWEQERMHIRFLLNVPPGQKEVDIKYKGQSWRNRTGQIDPTSADGEHWQVMVTVTLGTREDTAMPNQSPKASVKPYYRLKLNKVNEIRIVAFDVDGDYVKCKKSLFSEALSLSKYALKGLAVSEDCKVTLNTSSELEYKDDFWGGIAVTVQDFPRHQTKIGSTTAPSGYSIGGTPVQFLVQVLEHLDFPQFVQPTLEDGHEFTVYVGVIWMVDVYAKAVENTTIDEFVSFGDQEQNITQSEIKADELDRERVKQVQVSWKPEPQDVGPHIICTRVIDNTGVDSPEDKCFIVNVKGQTFSSSTNAVSLGKPFLFNLPSGSENVTCKVDSTCELPIFVNSSSKIDSVQVTISTVDTAYFNSIVTHESSVYQTDLFFRHSGYGVQTICILVTDINGFNSEEACITLDIEPQDPCFSSPCQNSGECIRRPEDKADYQCIGCPAHFYGKNCERKETERCKPNPCVNGGTCFPSGSRLCYCGLTDFVGAKCSINKDDCDGETCSDHGICKDGIGNYTCNCFRRYTGGNCSDDRCPGSPYDDLCPQDIAGCTSATCINGSCVGNGKCVCQLGYNEKADCSQAIGDIQAKYGNVTILPPTPEARSVITCYKDEQCDIDIYFTTGNSATSSITVYKQSDELTGKYITTSVIPWNEVSGLTGMYKTSIRLTVDVEIQGYVCAVVMERTTNGSDSICLGVKVTVNPETIKDSLEYKQRNMAIKFLAPTLLAESTIVCRKDKPCYIILYTTPSSPGQCDNPISADDGVNILLVEATSTNCRTQASVLLATKNNYYICFQSTRTSADAQKRCFNVQVLDRDRCLYTPCQNNAECFYSDDIFDDIRCECQPGYRGGRCEHGKCQPSENLCNIGYCEVDNHNIKCMCPIGYEGEHCDQSFPDAITNITSTGAQFTDIALPATVMCIRNRRCSVPLIASGHYSGSEKPDIRPGYTSRSVTIEDIDIKERTTGSYAVSVNLLGRRLGLYDVCVLSMNKLGDNRDELCFKANITEAMSTLYSDQDTPHFIESSVPTDSELVCKVDEPCHLLFTATPGEKYNSTECVTVDITQSTSVKYHVYSACDTCTIGSPEQLACSFDIVLYVTSDIDVCVEAKTTVTNTIGEKRCFTLTSSTSIAKKGCQTVLCENGGFCDGHVEPAKCHCRTGFSGPTCQTDESLQPSSGTTNQPLTGGSALPTNVICYINKPCLIPHSSLDASSNLTTGYLSPGVKVNSSLVIPGSPNGALQIDSGSPGQKTVCLQSTQGSSVDDEVCLTVNFAATGGPITDQARPYFTPPTYPKDTTIMCKANTTCHLDIHYTKGSLFNSSQDCPTLSETSSPAVDGIYIFPGTLNPSDCSSDISYIAPNVSTDAKEKLCVDVSLPGKRGEERCFIIQIVRDITDKVPRPCAGKNCQHGAVCVADMTVAPPVGNCVCSNGYEGVDCSQAVPTTNQLPGYVDTGSNLGSPQTPQTPHFDPSSSIPANIVCEQNRPCTINIPYRGDVNRPPLPGHIASALNITDTNVISTSINGLHLATYTINSTQSGVHKTCVQTTVNGSVGGMNLDEICFNVTVSGGSPTSPTSNPSPFDNNAFTNGSTMTCRSDTMCQLSVVTKGTPNCADIQECGSGIPGTHVFDTHQDGTICITSVAIKTGHSNAEQDLCLSAGLTGEQSHIKVEIADKSEYGPCQKIHCRYGGFCNGKDDAAVCECKGSYSGTECEIGPCTAALPAIQHGYFVNGSTEVMHGQKVMFACSPWYELADKTINFLVCDSMGNTWSGTRPLCKTKAVPATSNLPGYNDTGPNPVTPNSGQTPQTPHFDPSSSVPSNIACVENQPCTIQIPFRGVADKPPLPGHIASAVNVTDTSVVSTTTNGLHVATYTINSTQSGVHKACLQTTVNGSVGGMNLDEICFNISVSTGSPSTPPNPSGSPFSALTNGSTMTCPAEAVCQLSVVTKGTPSCTDIQECGSGTPGVHVLDTNQDGANCITSMVIETGHSDTAKSLCISDGTSGEQRHIQVEVTNKAGYGPCQKLHCLNGGFCNGKDSTPVCECKTDYSGQECEIGPCTAPLPDIKHGGFVIGSTMIVVNGDQVKVACNPGYELEDTSTDHVVCDSRANSWTGPLPVCTAKAMCFNDSDCLNDGTCDTRHCKCQPGFGNTNCDTERDQCRGESAIVAKKRAETVVKEGRVSCFCMVKGPDNVEKKVQIIKRRPKMPTSQILKHAGFGAGGVSGGMVICMILYHVVGKLKKKRPAQRPTSVNRVQNIQRMDF